MRQNYSLYKNRYVNNNEKNMDKIWTSRTNGTSLSGLSVGPKNGLTPLWF